MEFDKFKQENNKPIPKDVEVSLGEGNEIKHENQNENKKSISELYLLVNKLNSEIDRKEPFLQQAEDGIKKIQDRIPQVDDRIENNFYQEFCERLGNFEQKIDVLKGLQSKLTEIFTSNKDKSREQMLGSQVENLAETILKLESFKTNSDYDNKQFIDETKKLFPSLVSLKDQIASLADGKYNKYIEEKIANNEKQKLIDKDLEVNKLKENLEKLKVFQNKFEEELANLKIDRYNASINISKIEGTLE